jgi:hypothetical protein
MQRTSSSECQHQSSSKQKQESTDDVKSEDEGNHMTPDCEKTDTILSNRGSKQRERQGKTILKLFIVEKLLLVI